MLGKRKKACVTCTILLSLFQKRGVSRRNRERRLGGHFVMPVNYFVWEELYCLRGCWTLLSCNTLCIFVCKCTERFLSCIDELDFETFFFFWFWNAAIRGYALSYLSSCAGRIRFLLGTAGMVALDLDATLKGLFQRIVQHLENIPKPQGENISAITCDLSVRDLCKPFWHFLFDQDEGLTVASENHMTFFELWLFTSMNISYSWYNYWVTLA